MAQMNVEAAKMAAACEEALTRGVSYKGSRLDKEMTNKVEAMLLLAKCAVRGAAGSMVTVTDDDMRYVGHCLIDLYDAS
jgi:hypothetical protein